jgi:hypothetical protein
MSEYNFEKTGIEKFIAIDNQIRTLLTSTVYDGSNYNGTTLTVLTSRELTGQELTDLTELITNYTDPAVYLELLSTMTDASRSYQVNALSPSTVQSFIYTNTDSSGNGVFNAIKTILEFSTDDVALWSLFSGSLIVTYKLLCYTRNLTLFEETLDITDIANTWKSNALSLETGPKTVFRTHMVEGLRTVVADYDCVWNFMLTVSDAKLKTAIHCKQMLYYNIY